MFNSSKILDDSKIIKENPITIQDIQKTIKYINTLGEEKEEVIKEYEIFEEKEMHIKLKECIGFVKDSIKN